MLYFYTMPRWSTMPHATAAGPHGKALLAKFSVTTIPALVLLDGDGHVICTNTRVRLAAEPTSLGFPWRAPAGTRRLNPTVDFAMGPTEAPSAVGDRAPSQSASLRHKSAGVLPPGVQRPHRLERDRATQAPAVLADIADNIHQAPAEIHARAGTRRDAKRKSPPDIVDAGWPPKEPNRVATQVVPTIYPDAMQVVCNREQAQKNSKFVPSILARPKLEKSSQGEHTLLMHPQPLAKVHPFTPTLKEWRHGIPVDCGPDWKWDVITAAVDHGPHPTT
jgi:hypothetical protein